MKKNTVILPLDVARTVASLCNDYDRRVHELALRKKPEAVLKHYAYLNAAIDDALGEVCEESIREPMRRDIGLMRGHRMSPIYYISEKTYKLRKRNAKLRIAEKLHLF